MYILFLNFKNVISMENEPQHIKRDILNYK